MANNKLIVNDVEYDLNKAYRAGALDLRKGVPWTCNPYKEGSVKHDQWSYGHINESEDLHMVNGVDFVLAKPEGLVFISKKSPAKKKNKDKGNF
jgi:hypothetical protein